MKLVEDYSGDKSVGSMNIMNVIIKVTPVTRRRPVIGAAIFATITSVVIVSISFIMFKVRNKNYQHSRNDEAKG